MENMSNRDKLNKADNFSLSKRDKVKKGDYEAHATKLSEEHEGRKVRNSKMSLAELSEGDKVGKG